MLFVEKPYAFLATAACTLILIFILETSHSDSHDSSLSSFRLKREAEAFHSKLQKKLTGACEIPEGGGTPTLACCGHRGARQLAPENTLTSFWKAVEVGANCFELDVHLTADGQLAVVHGRTLQEKLLLVDQGVEARQPEEMQWAEIQALDAGAWFSSHYAGHRVSLLAEVAQAFWDVPVQIVVELKTRPCFVERCPAGKWEELFAVALLEWLNKEEVQSRGEPRLCIILSSFNHGLIDLLADMLEKEVPLKTSLRKHMAGLAYILAPDHNASEASLRPSVEFIAPMHTKLEETELLWKGKRQAITWVVDDVQELEDLAKQGVQSIISNDPTLCHHLCG